MTAPVLPGFPMLREPAAKAEHLEDRFARVYSAGREIVYRVRLFCIQLGEATPTLYGEVWAEWAVGNRDLPAIGEINRDLLDTPGGRSAIACSLMEALVGSVPPGFARATYRWEERH